MHRINKLWDRYLVWRNTPATKRPAQSARAARESVSKVDIAADDLNKQSLALSTHMEH